MLAVKRVAEIGVIVVGNLPLRLRPERVLLGLDQKYPVSCVTTRRRRSSSRETCQVTWGLKYLRRAVDDAGVRHAPAWLCT